MVHKKLSEQYVIVRRIDHTGLSLCGEYQGSVECAAHAADSTDCKHRFLHYQAAVYACFRAGFYGMQYDLHGES